VGRPPPRPRASGLRSSLSVCQAIFSGKLEMLIHAALKILLQGQSPQCSTWMSLYRVWPMYYFDLKKTVVHKQEIFLRIMKKLNSCAKSRKLIQSRRNQCLR
jgi:hypothetical protein